MERIEIFPQTRSALEAKYYYLFVYTGITCQHKRAVLYFKSESTLKCLTE